MLLFSGFFFCAFLLLRFLILFSIPLFLFCFVLSVCFADNLIMSGLDLTFLNLNCVLGGRGVKVSASLDMSDTRRLISVMISLSVRPIILISPEMCLRLFNLF